MNVNGRRMAEVAPRLGVVHDLDARGETLIALIPRQRWARASFLQHDVRELLDGDNPLLLAPNIVDLARFEVVGDVCERAAGVLDVVEDALVAPMDCELAPGERAVDE